MEYDINRVMSCDSIQELANMHRSIKKDIIDLTDRLNCQNYIKDYIFDRIVKLVEKRDTEQDTTDSNKATESETVPPSTDTKDETENKDEDIPTKDSDKDTKDKVPKDETENKDTPTKDTEDDKVPKDPKPEVTKSSNKKEQSSDKKPEPSKHPTEFDIKKLEFITEVLQIYKNAKPRDCEYVNLDTKRSVMFKPSNRDYYTFVYENNTFRVAFMKEQTGYYKSYHVQYIIEFTKFFGISFLTRVYPPSHKEWSNKGNKSEKKPKTKETPKPHFYEAPKGPEFNPFNTSSSSNPFNPSNTPLLDRLNIKSRKEFLIWSKTNHPDKGGDKAFYSLVMEEARKRGYVNNPSTAPDYGS